MFPLLSLLSPCCPQQEWWSKFDQTSRRSFFCKVILCLTLCWEGRLYPSFDIHCIHTAFRIRLFWAQYTLSTSFKLFPITHKSHPHVKFLKYRLCQCDTFYLHKESFDGKSQESIGDEIMPQTRLIFTKVTLAISRQKYWRPKLRPRIGLRTGQN